MIDLIIIYTALFICGAIVLSFTIVVGFALYFSYNRNATAKLYKSKVTQDNWLSMSGLPKPTRPMPKCKPNRELNINPDPTYPRPPAPPYPPPRDVRGRSKKEPCCDCGRSMSNYWRNDDTME